jgi:hypothetical protein
MRVKGWKQHGMRLTTHPALKGTRVSGSEHHPHVTQQLQNGILVRRSARFRYAYTYAGPIAGCACRPQSKAPRKGASNTHDGHETGQEHRTQPEVNLGMLMTACQLTPAVPCKCTLAMPVTLIDCNCLNLPCACRRGTWWLPRSSCSLCRMALRSAIATTAARGSQTWSQVHTALCRWVLGCSVHRWHLLLVEREGFMGLVQPLNKLVGRGCCDKAGVPCQPCICIVDRSLATSSVPRH